jgi:hypothetical protein
MTITTTRPYASPPNFSKTQGKYMMRQLRKHGWKTFRQYITSKSWWRTKERYRQTELPQDCVVCGDPNVDLHHRTYKRLGEEKMTDLFPLCREHHDQAHRLDRELAARGVQHQGLWGIASILRQQFEREVGERLASRDESLRARLLVSS